MKKLFLLLFLIPVLTFSFSQEIKKVDVKKEKQITKINNDVTVFNKNTFVHPTKISKAVYHDVLPSLKDLPPVTNDYYKVKNRRVADGFEHDEAEGADYSNRKPMGEDPVWQKKPGKVEQNNTKALQKNFVGQTSPYMPSDCNGTVGPNHFFQTVNSTYAIWDKAGTQVVTPTAMNTLFSGVTGASNNDGDPLILWDEQASRWVAVEFSVAGGPPYYMLIAVSQSSDPTLGWDRWSFTMNGMPDYEKLGIASDGYFMGTNTTSGDDIYVFDRSVMITGGASPQMLQFNNPNRPNPSGFNCVMPIDNDGTFDTGHSRFIAINDDAWGNEVNTGKDELWVFDCTPDWTTPSNSTFGRSQAIVVSAFDSQFQPWGDGDIAQPGETQKVDANPYVLMSRGQYKTFGGNEYIVCDHTVDVDNTDHAGIRWYQLQKNAGVWTLKQEGTYAPDGESRWMGSIAMNDYGQIALAYSVSGTVSPEIRYTGQTSCALSGTMDVAEQTVSTSLTPQSQPTYNRWGDYFLTTVDPSDNVTFWSTLEYYNGGKKTQIFSYRIDESCSAPTITSVDYNTIYADRGKNLTVTGTDFLGCSFVLNGVTGTEASNDGTTAVINFPPAAYDATNSLVVSNIVGSDNTVVTVNTRTTIPVDASAAANSDTHQTISSATDGIADWLGSNAFTSPIIINVAAGTYTESITLNNNLNPTTANPLTIQNSSGASPVVDATGNNYGFNLGTVNYVTLKGFQVHSANNSNIYSQGSSVTLKYNKAYNAVGDNSSYGLAGGSGIKIETGTPVNVYNNLIYGNISNGIEVTANNTVIKNNTCDNNGGQIVHKTNVQVFYDDLENPTIWNTTDWSWYSGSLFTVSANHGYGIYNKSDYITSDAIDITGYTNLTISTYARSYYSGLLGGIESSDNMTGEYSFDGSNWTNFFSINGDHPSWIQYSANSINPTSNTLYIRFYGNVNGGFWDDEYWFIDDIKVTGDENFTDYYQGNAILVSNGTGSTVENNIFSAKTGNTAYHALKLTNSASINSDYNTYYSLTGTVFDNNGTTGNSGAPLGTNDLTSNPLFVGSGDYHLQSTTGSYTASKAPIWPPETATGGVWSNDANDSPAIDAGNPADTYANEPADNGNRINQGVYGNTAQGSKAPPLPCVVPSTQASNFVSTPHETSIDLTWTRGDGDNVIILAHEAVAVDSDPVSGTSYTANTAFGSGSEIGTGNYVVYNNSGNSVTVTGLNPNTTYYFAIYEYNNTDVCYLTPGATVNELTLPAQPSAVSGDATPCEASTQTYSVTNVSGITYTWSVPGDWSINSGQGSNSISVTVGTNNGTVQVTPSNASGNGTARTLTVTVSPLPVAATSVSASPSSITSGNSSTLTYTGGSGTTFTWYTGSCGGTFVGTGQDLSVSPTSTTTYYGAWSNSCGESSCQSVTVTVTIPPPAITNVNPNNFFADKGATLTITGLNLGDLTTTVTLGGITGTMTSNDGSTLVVDFPAGHYTNSTLTVSTGTAPDATSTVTVNTRNTIPVGGGTDFHATIQDALDGLYAWFGTNTFSTNTTGYLAGTKTIEVYNGTYTDIVTPNVNLGTSASEGLIIQNASGQQPVINANGNVNAFNIGALDYVTVSGFTAYSSSDALIYTEGNYNTITLNKLYSSTAGTGIILNNAASTVVENNLVYDNYNFGIRLISSNNAVVKNNTVANNGHESKAPPLPGVYTPAQLYVQSGTGVSAENNIFYAKSGTNVFTLVTESGITISSDYNTYYKNGNTSLVLYNGTTYADLAAWNGNGAGTNDLEGDPLFVNAATDFHIQSTNGSYPYPAEWPPIASASAWNNDASTSPALDTGNPSDSYSNETVSGGRINQGAYGNTAQASKSAGIIWNGSVSIDWQTPNNWTPNTALPTATDDIIIPDGCSNYPVIDDGTTTAVCNNMTIAANASVTIAANGQMTVSGSITNNRGAAGLIIKSDASGDGSLIVNNTPEATVERYVTGNKWHMMFPTLSAIPTATFTAEGTYTNNNFYSYSEPNEDYWNTTTIFETTGWTSEVSVSNINTDYGYLFNRYNMSNKSFVQTGGTLYSEDKVFDVSYTVSSVTIGNGVTQTRDYFDGWNLVGNTYTSAVDWDQVTLNGIESGIYYFDGTNYQYYIPGGGSAPYNIGITANSGSQYIPSGQGFMVKVNNTGLTHNTTFTIPATARVHYGQPYWKNSTVQIPNLLRLNIEKDGYTDETVIRTLPVDVTENHDAKYDAYKMFAWDNSKPQLFSIDGNNAVYAINSVPEITTKKVIPLGIYIGAAGQYQINTIENNFSEYDVFLHDISKDSYSKLSNNYTYSFDTETGTINDRFELVFEKSSSNLENIDENSVLLFPNPNKGSFYLSINNTVNNFRVEITNVTGQLIYQNKFFGNGTKEINFQNVSNGIYFVKIIFENNKIINKKIVVE